jgi:hypothetical protein
MNRLHRRRLLGGILALALAAAGLPALIAPNTDAATRALVITLDCDASRERTTIRNTRSMTVTIRTIGSLYRPYGNEPFTVNRKLAAGRTATFFTGRGAPASSSTTLTRRNIYKNDVSTEGVRVTSSAGSFTKRC